MNPLRCLSVLAVIAMIFAAHAATGEELPFTLATDAIADDAPAELVQARDLYLARGGTGEKAREMLAVLGPYLEKNPDDYDAIILASMACFWICDRTGNEDVKKEFGLKGYELGEKAMALRPGDVAGYYFYIITLGEYGKGISILKALTMKLDKNYREAGNKAVSLDASYEAGGPHRALGRFFFKLPWPKYDAEASIEHLKKGIALAPRKVRTHFYLAETLIKEKEWEQAEAAIEKGLAVTPYDFDRWEAGHYKEKLRALQKEVEARK